MRRVVRVEVMEDIVQTVFQMRVEHRRHPFQLGLVSKIVGSGYAGLRCFRGNLVTFR
jgi:hypothetical protein